MIYLVYLLIGAVGGLVIGCIGSGSSLIILPFLSLILSHIYPIDIAIKLSVATCLSTLVVGSFFGAKTYIKNKEYDKNLVTICLPSIVLGSIVSSLISSHLPGQVIKYYISILLILISLYKLYQLLFRKNNKLITKQINRPYIIIVSFISCVCSGLAGVALGILIIPLLSSYSDHRKIVGTNLILGVPYSVISTFSYFILSKNSDLNLHIPHTLGYIYLPAFFCIAITMAIFPTLGKKISYKISIHKLQMIFYSYLFIAGFIMIYA